MDDESGAARGSPPRPTIPRCSQPEPPLPPVPRCIATTTLLAGLAVGCGRLGFDASPDSGWRRPVESAPSPAQGTPDGTASRPHGQPPVAMPDGGMQQPQLDDSGTGDATIANDAGQPSSSELSLEPFTFVRPLAALNTDSHEDDPGAAADILELVFARDVDGDEDLWTARRLNVADDFGAPTPLAALNTTARETAPWLSGDGLRLIFASTRDGQARHYEARRADRTADWSTPMPLELGRAAGTGRIAETADGLRRAFTLEGERLAETWRGDVDAPWEGYRELVEVNLFASQGDAYLLAGGHILLFRVQREVGGHKDLVAAFRTDLSGTFQSPVAMDSINTQGREGDPWLSENQQTLLFTRDGDLYEARR